MNFRASTPFKLLFKFKFVHSFFGTHCLHVIYADYFSHLHAVHFFSRTLLVVIKDFAPSFFVVIHSPWIQLCSGQCSKHLSAGMAKVSYAVVGPPLFMQVSYGYEDL